mmetsp:Transcript_23360/g.55288  ORF Transcript_23360/g.55288 Transcript_23360/m.55288 type:complete len:227 (+) Transcript_23360:136-816(+)
MIDAGDDRNGARRRRRSDRTGTRERSQSCAPCAKRRRSSERTLPPPIVRNRRDSSRDVEAPRVRSQKACFIFSERSRGRVSVFFPRVACEPTSRRGHDTAHRASERALRASSHRRRRASCLRRHTPGTSSSAIHRSRTPRKTPQPSSARRSAPTDAAFSRRASSSRHRTMASPSAVPVTFPNRPRSIPHPTARTPAAKSYWSAHTGVMIVGFPDRTDAAVVPDPPW